VRRHRRELAVGDVAGELAERCLVLVVDKQMGAGFHGAESRGVPSVSFVTAD
jgi:hypothetical protein